MKEKIFHERLPFFSVRAREGLLLLCDVKVLSGLFIKIFHVFIATRSIKKQYIVFSSYSSLFL